MSTPCIITAKEKPTLAIYIHYDGDDIQMVKDIVDIAIKNEARNPNYDEAYGMARLVCACQEYFQNKTTGFGIFAYKKSHSYGENYHYTIDAAWNVEEV